MFNLVRFSATGGQVSLQGPRGAKWISSARLLTEMCRRAKASTSEGHGDLWVKCKFFDECFLKKHCRPYGNLISSNHSGDERSGHRSTTTRVPYRRPPAPSTNRASQTPRRQGPIQRSTRCALGAGTANAVMGPVRSEGPVSTRCLWKRPDITEFRGRGPGRRDSNGRGHRPPRPARRFKG